MLWPEGLANATFLVPAREMGWEGGSGGDPGAGVRQAGAQVRVSPTGTADCGVHYGGIGGITPGGSPLPAQGRS